MTKPITDAALDRIEKSFLRHALAGIRPGEVLGLVALIRAAEAERDAALVAASALRNQAASYVEAVKDDRPNISEHLTPAVDLIRCMDTREIIGARIYIAARAALEESNG